MRVALCLAALLVAAGCVAPAGPPSLSAEIEAGLAAEGYGGMLDLPGQLAFPAGETEPADMPAEVSSLLRDPRPLLDEPTRWPRAHAATLGMEPGRWRAVGAAPSHRRGRRGADGRSVLRAFLRDLDRAATPFAPFRPRKPGALSTPDLLQAVAYGPDEVGSNLTTLYDRGQAAAAASARVQRASARFAARWAALSPAARARLAPGRWAGPFGPVQVAGRGADRHRPVGGRPPDAVTIDLGGNDLWEGPGLVPPGTIQVRVDLGGRDLWLGSDLALWSVGVSLDLGPEGDLRSGGAGTQAASLGGVALLADLGGDDLYVATGFAQAAAAWGTAVLLDRTGADRYQGVIAVQAAAYSGARALLWDGSGNDRYLATGVRDTAGRPGTLTLAQGFATGIREPVAGGVALLRDDSGDDHYRTSLYGQAAAYWYALAMLEDQAGDDLYEANNYGQSAAVHAAVALLLDGSGDDAYLTAYDTGVASGYDMSVAYLRDVSGDDRYAVKRWGMGGTYGNGFGVLEDLAGADLYQGRLEVLGQRMWLRRLPGGGAQLDRAPAGDRYELEVPEAPGLLGRLSRAADSWWAQPEPDASCPELPDPLPPELPDEPAAVADALAGWADRTRPEPERTLALARLVASLPEGLERLTRVARAEGTAAAFALRDAGVCYLRQADEAGAARLAELAVQSWRLRGGGAPTWLVTQLLTRIESPVEARRGMLEALLDAPGCRTRASGFTLALGADLPAAPPDWLAARLEAAMDPSCPQLQAAALALADQFPGWAARLATDPDTAPYLRDSARRRNPAERQE